MIQIVLFLFFKSPKSGPTVNGIVQFFEKYIVLWIYLGIINVVTFITFAAEACSFSTSKYTSINSFRTLIIPGTCTSEKLGTDGTLLTDKNGIALFEGLRVFTAEGKAIRYRVTELQTLNGSSLMPDQIWEGTMDGSETFEVVLGVVNSPILELPKTGSSSARIISIFAALFTVAGVTLLMTRRKKVQ